MKQSYSFASKRKRCYLPGCRIAEQSSVLIIFTRPLFARFLMSWKTGVQRIRVFRSQMLADADSPSTNLKAHRSSNLSKKQNWKIAMCGLFLISERYPVMKACAKFWTVSIQAF